MAPEAISQTPPQDVPYIDRVYTALKDNLTGFNKTPDQFRAAMKDQSYATKAYTALRDNLSGFDKTEDDFYHNVGLKKISVPNPSIDVSGAQINNFQNSQPLSPVLPEHRQQVYNDQKERADRVSKTLSDNLKMLAPETRAQIEKIIPLASNQGEINAVSPEKQKHYEFMQTPAGKALGKIAYLGSKATKGSLQVLKGAAYLMDMGTNPVSAVTGGNPAVNNAFDYLDEKANYGLTKGDQQRIESNPVMQNLGGLAEFAPAMAAGASTGGSTFYLQGLGQGKDVIDHAEKNGAQINPVVKNAFILGTGAVNGLLMGELGGSMFKSLPAGLRGDIAATISADAIKEAVGKELTGKEFSNLLEKGATEFKDKLAKGGVSALEGYKHAVTNLGALTGANFALKKGVDVANDTPVFNETAGDLAEQLNEVATKQAPFFAIPGAVGALSKLTKYSNYKNSVVEDLMNDHSADNVEKVRTALADHGYQNGWSNEEIEGTLKNVDEIASVAKALPKGLPKEKMIDAVDLVQGRKALETELASEQENRKSLDPAFADMVTPKEQLLVDKIDQANDKLREIATGSRVTYSKGRGEEDGLFFKTVDGKKEEITSERYALEKLERDSKQEQPIANEQATPNPETTAPIQEQPAEPAVASENSIAPVETPVEEVKPVEDANATDVSEKDAIRKSIETETDPKKIAAQYHHETSEPDYIEKGIIDYLGNSKINLSDYERWGDKNNITEGKKLRWLDTKNSDRTGLDQHAEALSHELGVQVTPEDFIETIDRYSGRKNFEEANKTETQRLLENRYQELTGKTLTPRRAEMAVGKLAKLDEQQSADFNKSAKEIGITEQDINDYEQYRKAHERGAGERGNAEPAKTKVQQSKNEPRGRKEKDSGGEGLEGKPKAGDPLREFATKVREGKINKLGGFRAGTGFDAAWDASLEVIATAIEGGAKVADAIEAGLKHVKQTEWYKNLTNKDEFDKQYRDHLTNEYAETEKALPAKNEANEKVAKELGLKVDKNIGQRTNEVIEREATDAIKDGYDAPELVDDILNNSHTATDTEVAILAKYRDAKLDEIKAQNDRLAEDGATMSKKQFEALTEANTQALLDMQDIVQAIKKTGTETARALRARQMDVQKEYSLANMIVQKRQANGGEKLSAEQLADVTKKYQELETLKNELEARLKKVEADNAKLKAAQTVKRVGAMRRSVTKAELSAERQKIFDNIRTEFKKIRQSGQAMSDIPYRRELEVVAKHMPALLRNLAQEGIVRIEDVVDNIYNTLKPDLEDITKRDVTDLIAGKYDEVKPTRSELQNDIRALRIQAKLAAEIEDIKSGKKTIKSVFKGKPKNEHVEQLRTRLNELIKNNTELSDADRLSELKKRIQEKIDNLSKRIADGDYSKEAPQKPIPIDAEALALRRKYDRIKNEFDVEVAKDALRQRSKTEKLKDDLLNIASLPRALKASLDFSAVLRQGLFASAGHPKEALTAFKEMFKQTFSEERYKNWLSDLKHSEYYDLMKDSDLYLSDKDNPKIIAKEEEFTSNLADKIPGIGKLVAASERAYTGYLNVLRAGVFESTAKELIKRGYTFENNPDVFKGIAKVVNVLTGRGDIPKALGGDSPKVLSNILFSPRFMASRIQTLYLWADPRLPKEAKIMAAKDIGATLAIGATLLSLAALAGYKVNTDPTSTNFLKIQDENKNGTTYYDILGGLPQYIRFLSQQVTGKTVSANGNETDLTAPRGLNNRFGKTRLDVTTSFLRGKVSPLLGSMINLQQGKDVVGNPYTFWPNVPQEFVPLPFSDVKEAYDIGDINNALKVFLPSQFGVGVSSYQPK